MASVHDLYTICVIFNLFDMLNMALKVVSACIHLYFNDLCINEASENM